MQKEKQLVPKLRFPEFDGNWIKNKLSENIEFIAGYAFKSNRMKSVDSKYQLIKMSNVYKNKLDLDRNPSYWDDLDNKTQKFLLKEKDILLTLTGTVGKKDYGYSVVIPKSNRFLLNQRLVCLRAKNNISDSDFINNLIKTSKFYYSFFAESKGGTGNQSNVGIEDLRNISLNFPTLPEQQKIADFLSAVDTRIQNLEKKKELLEQYKKGITQKIFKQEIRFKDGDGKAFPEWEDKKLGVIFEEIRNKVGKQNIETYSISAGKGFISQKEKFGKDISGNQNERYIVVEENQFSYNKGNSKTYQYGCVYLNKTGKRIAVPNVFISFKATASEVVQDFYSHYFIGHNLDRDLRKMISSSARMDGLLNISKENFFKIKIPLPSLEEQQKIANFLSAIDQRINLVTQQITQTKTYKKGLLQQMFV